MNQKENNQTAGTPEPMPQPEKPKHGFSLVKLGVCAAAGLLVVLTAVNARALANTVRKTFSSPAGYYRSVEANALSSGVQSMTSGCTQVLDTLDERELRQSLTVSAELGEKLKRLVKKNTDVDISELGAVGVSVSTITQKDMFGMGASVQVDNKSVLSLDGLVDFPNGQAFFQIPELSKKYIGLDIESESAAEELQEQYEQLKKLTKGFPKQKDLNKILNRYIKLALEQIRDVTKSSETIEADGVSQKCTALIVEIDEDTLSDILEAFAAELEKDEDLKKFIVDAVNAVDEDGEDAYEEFVEEAVETLEKLARSMEEVRIALTMTVYVDGKGDVRGRKAEIRITETYEDWSGERITSVIGAEAEFLAPVDGNRAGIFVCLKSVTPGEGSTVVFKTEGSGRQSFGKLTGELRVKAMGLTVADITVTGLDLWKLREGHLNGTVEISPSNVSARWLQQMLPWELSQMLSEANLDLEKVSLVFELENSDKKNLLGMKAVYKEDMLFQISVARESKSKADTKVPSEKNVIFAEDEEDFKEWLDSCDWDGFLRQLEKAKLPQDLVDFVEEFSDVLQDNLDNEGIAPDFDYDDYDGYGDYDGYDDYYDDSYYYDDGDYYDDSGYYGELED